MPTTKTDEPNASLCDLDTINAQVECVKDDFKAGGMAALLEIHQMYLPAVREDGSLDEKKLFDIAASDQLIHDIAAEDFFSYFQAELDRIGGDSWEIDGRIIDWRGRSGTKRVRTSSAEEMFRAIAPNCDLSARLWSREDWLEMTISHHDVPTGSFYVIRKAKPIVSLLGEHVELTEEECSALQEIGIISESYDSVAVYEYNFHDNDVQSDERFKKLLAVARTSITVIHGEPSGKCIVGAYLCKCSGPVQVPIRPVEIKDLYEFSVVHIPGIRTVTCDNSGMWISFSSLSGMDVRVCRDAAEVAAIAIYKSSM